MQICTGKSAHLYTACNLEMSCHTEETTICACTLQGGQGPEDKCYLPYALNHFCGEGPSPGQAVEGCAESPWDLLVSAYFIGREAAKRTAAFCEAKRARSFLGSV